VWFIGTWIWSVFQSAKKSSNGICIAVLTDRTWNGSNASANEARLRERINVQWGDDTCINLRGCLHHTHTQFISWVTKGHKWHVAKNPDTCCKITYNSSKFIKGCCSRALDNFSTEEYVTSSVLRQGVFDSSSLTLVIGAKIFNKC
jgi:hypothetical protein